MRSAQSSKISRSRSLGSQSLFSCLPRHLVVELERRVIFARHGAGSIVYRQGEKAHGIFVVLAGRVKLSAIASGARTALLRIAEPGAVLGLAALLSQNPHLTTAQATESAEMALLLGSDLASAMQNYPELAKAIAQHLAAEYIESAGETLSLRVPCSSSQKLAALILRISKIGSSGLPACQSAFTYTHAELGQLIGASRETVTRLMKLLQRQGVIATRKSTFRITNQRLLREIAEPG